MFGSFIYSPYICAEKKIKPNMNEKLGLEEYSNFMVENISKLIINRNYIEENSEFFNLLFFKMFEDYEYSTLEPISLLKQLKLLEIFLGAMITEHPSTELPEDSLYHNRALNKT
jgi:hypothetical protein